MQEGVAKVYDPAPFANLLGIDKGIQQDPQVRLYVAVAWFLPRFKYYCPGWCAQCVCALNLSRALHPLDNAR